MSKVTLTWKKMISFFNSFHVFYIKNPSLNACACNVNFLSESTMRVMRNLDINMLGCQFQSHFKHYKFHKLNGIASKHFGESACVGRIKNDININTNYWQYLIITTFNLTILINCVIR